MGEYPDDEVLSLYELVRDGEVTKLIRYLEHSENPETRGNAAEALGDLAERSEGSTQTRIIDALVTAVLEDDHQAVRTRAISSLDRHGREAIDQLISEIDEFDAEQTPDWLTRKKLVEWLQSDAVEFQLVAASALGRIGDEHAVPYLVDAFDHLDPRVRARAITACGHIGDRRAIDPIAARLTDSERIVQRAAADTLAMIGTTAAIERLIPAARADDKQVRAIAVSELGQLKNAKPLDALGAALTDDSAEVRQAALLSVIELLIADTAADDDIRQSVTRQVTTIDDTELTQRLLEIYSDTTRMAVKRTVIWILGRGISPEADNIDTVHSILLDVLDVEPLADKAEASLAELESTTLEDRLLTFVQRQTPSPEAKRRAEALLDRIDTERVDENVRTSVEYTYVQDPADYTRQKRHEND
ncbi:HEAT repeat domain-containing protein [Halobellus sp. EA9]|uniref:HEAT repeat domain-containing protein n=1 Tax=Halobellus sp. EA9 TaxID=3421647 RepID=UPI003EB96105